MTRCSLNMRLYARVVTLGFRMRRARQKQSVEGRVQCGHRLRRVGHSSSIAPGVKLLAVTGIGSASTECMRCTCVGDDAGRDDWLRMSDVSSSVARTHDHRYSCTDNITCSSHVAGSARAPRLPCSRQTAVRTLCEPPRPAPARQPQADPPLHATARHTAHRKMYLASTLIEPWNCNLTAVRHA